ncbi:MAG: NAD(P)-binding domain-containing protein, partial [Planctomycetota bacterium]|nr:NAD(P)-binding domain-containing protein [Planctomycetota bacterium]
MTPPATCSIGLIGLAVMGRNLALNIARKGFPIAVFNRTTSKVTSFLSEDVRDDDPVQGALTLEEFTGMLERPRRIIIMVQAGDPVDATITQLLPLLDPGDIIIDAGNSHPDDTTR